MGANGLSGRRRAISARRAGFLACEGTRIPRIQELIERGARKPLLTVLGALGSGKTTQVALFAQGWEARDKAAVAWHTVSIADNDPKTFWQSMIASVTAALGLVSFTERFPDSGNGSGAVQEQSSQARLVALCDALGSIDVELLWVVNDLELIDSGMVLGSLEQFAFLVPSNVHLVLLSRQRRIPLSRLRMEDRVAEIRGTDLALTEREIIQLAAARGVTLSSREAHELGTVTRGWAAGLHMIFLRAGRGRQPADFKTLFAYDQWFVDYLNEEVLPELGKESFDVALKICAVKGFTRAMMEQAFGCSQAARVLGELRSANLAVTLSGAPLGEQEGEGEWFECHPLFVGPLRHLMFMDRSSQAIAETVDASVDWYEEQGHYDFAIETALAQGDYDRVFDLVTLHLYPILTAADSSTFSQWFEGLSHPHGEKEYLFFLVNAWASFIAGKAKRAHMWLSRIEERVPSGDADMLRGTNSIYHAVKVGTLVFVGDYKEALELGSSSLDNLGGPQLFLRCTIMHNMGEALERLGRYQEAYEYFMRAKVNAEMSGRRVVELLCANEIGWLHFVRGHLDASTNVVMKALASCNDEELSSSWAVGLLYVTLARAYLQWANIDKAQENLDKAFKLLGAQSNLDGYLEARVMESQLLLYGDQAGNALDVLMEAYETLQVDSAPRGVNLLVLTMYASSLADVGRCEHARQILVEARMQTCEEDQYYRVRQMLVEAKLHWCQNDPARANEVIEEALVIAKESDTCLLIPDLLCLQACIARDMGEKDDAVRLLSDALDHAFPESYLHPFMHRLPHLDSLLFDVAHPANSNLVLADRRLNARRLAQEVIARKGISEKEEEPSEGQRTEVISSLSERERQVYELLKKGRTRKQIADELGIQINTVRTHARNIYQKLGVHERSAL